MRQFQTLMLGFCLISSVFAAPVSENIMVGSTSRNMLTHVPSGLEKDSPLFISLHGMNQDAPYQQGMAHWEDIADTARFAVVYPNGINKSWDLSGNRDIDFVLAIIDTMYNRHQIDRNRVYLSGFSMGGMFTYHAMGRIADKIAAFAPVSGYPMGGSAFQSSRPIPIIHTHGTSDDVVRYSGVAKIVEGWRKRNNCPSQGVTTTPYPQSKPNSKSKLDFWGPCDDGVNVALLTLDGKGHWHSNDGAVGVHSSHEIWNFVKNYSLTGSSIVVVPSPRDSIFNGKFDQGKSAWTLNVWDGEATGTIDNEEYKIDVSSIGTENYQIQLIQSGLILEKDQSYKLTFDARATASRSIEVNVEQHEDPWASYLESVQNFDLTTTKSTYSFVFTMNAATDQNGRLSFNFGGATGTVFLDNVVIEKTDAPPTVISGKMHSIQTKVSYSHGNLFVKFDTQKNKQVQLLVYNLQGVEVVSKMLLANNGIEQRVDFSALSAGRYLVQVRSGNLIMKSMNILHY